MVNPEFLEQGFRWYGDRDPVSLEFIRQAGAESVFTSLHEIPYGKLWEKKAIAARKKTLEKAGLKWGAVESLPVSEDIKLGAGNRDEHIFNYKESLKNLGECGIKIVIYNFMPVLDWVRTDLHYRLPDGSTCLRFDPVQFAAFEIFILKRPGAERDYSKKQLEKAEKFFGLLSATGKKKFEKSIIDTFPGCKMGLKISDVRKMLDLYSGISAASLGKNLDLFLKEVVPVAEKYEIKLAIHPDDPPFGILGLPRIASNLSDFKRITRSVDSPSNGVAFCTGSLSASPKNDIPKMLNELEERVFVAHLRSTQRDSDGSFKESGHIEGSVPMFEVVSKLLEMQEKRLAKGGDKILFRPDHGRDMADDLLKPPTDNPGYSYIGRMKGLAELRGLQFGILKSRRTGKRKL